MDAPCEPGVKISVSTTPTASVCRFVPNASDEQIAEQQNSMLGMLRRLGILGPIVWAAYWGDSDLADCERLWVLEGELAGLYVYLNAGIASGTGMPELQSSSLVKRASYSASGPATSNAREAFIRPILEKKGFSVHDWARTAKVDFHTANNYLKGKTRPYPSTLKKLADALDVEVVKFRE
jgi:lambda repressor-like predicted transcriptional regulator